MGDSTLWIGLLAIPLLLLLSAVLVASEIAFVTLRRAELDDLVQVGRAGAHAARALVDQLERAIAAIQVGITAIGLLLGWLAESSVADLLRPHLARSFPAVPGAVSHALAGGLVLVLLTGLQVILGELAPKALALQHPRAVALLVARPLLFFCRAVTPIVWLLNGGAALVLRLVRLRPPPPLARAHSVRELAALVDETHRAGALRAEQAEVLQNVFRLPAKTARDIMLPLERAGMLDLGWPADRVLDAVVEGAHTRMPVFEGQRTRIVGLVNTKDLFRLVRRTGTVDLRQVLRPVPSVSPDAHVEEQLQRFRKGRLHMAVVREGETPVGLVTLEDLIEEVVGDIEDEQDRPPPPAPTPAT